MKFHSKPVPEHAEVPLADEGQLESIVERSRKRQAAPPSGAGEGASRCFVLSVSAEEDPLIRQAQLGEILSLTRAQGGIVVGEAIHRLTKSNPRTLIGPGKAREYADIARAQGATMLVVDAELSPSQLRNLEDAAGMAVCDREAIILNVFLRHASSRRARVQVEIAQLEYLRPRICGVGINMDQQAGGIGGGRGPGETASELMARKLDGRLAELKKVQQRLEQSGESQRHSRVGCRRIALVGYTNAGKTSLMNALTSERLRASDRPFETLDTTTRSLTRHGGDILVSDTVGFIRRLPQKLMASFESTLAEIREASLLAIVVDASDHEWERHVQATVEMLEKLSAQGIPRHYVFNKADRLSSAPTREVLEAVSSGHPFTLLSSADEAAVRELRETLLRRVRGEQESVELIIPYANSRAMSAVYGQCRVIASTAAADGLKVTVQGSPEALTLVKQRLEEETR